MSDRMGRDRKDQTGKEGIKNPRKERKGELLQESANKREKGGRKVIVETCT